MERARLSPWSGEFIDGEREREFVAERLPEAKRFARLLLGLSAVLNLLFLLSDWRFFGQPHFAVAVSARLAVVAASMVAFAVVPWVGRSRALDWLLMAWQAVTAVAVAFLVHSHSEIALMAMLVLPTVYYLAVPLPFTAQVIGGFGCSLLLLAAYVDFGEGWRASLGLALAVLVLNTALVLAGMWFNRLIRRQWGAAQAERRTNALLKQNQDLLEMTFRAVPVPLVITTLDDGRILKYSDAAVAYYGGSPEACGITSIDQIYVDPACRARFVAELAREGGVNNFEAAIRLADGTERNVLLAARMIDIDGARGLVTGAVDVTERIAAERRAVYAATHDALTGLPNRAAFQSLLEAALAEAPRKGGVSLLLVDLDGLKDVNDTLGHDAGDALIAETARRLESLARERGTVARLGGDEFVILLGPPADLEAGRRLAQAIINDFRRPFSCDHSLVSVRASVGLAACPDHDCVAGELMKDADVALYAAKQQGRNRAVVYNPAMRKAVMDRVTLSREVSAALSNGHIVPFYQPKVSLATGALVGFEALVRWQQGAYSVLAPADFDAALVVPELALLIGERMARQVASDVRGWLEAGRVFGRVAINLSPAQFSHRDLANTLLRVFHAAGVGTEYLEVEITETVFLGRGSDHVKPIVDDLYRAGVRIALDDFGTGYAALTHLKSLPIDTIKIDQSFVRDIERDPYDTAIVCAVIELGKTLGLRVIAEGVETVGQARFLKERGCELVQGFLYGRPMAASEVALFLAAEGLEVAAGRRALLA